MKSKLKILFETKNRSRFLRHFLLRKWNAPFIYLLTHEFERINKKSKEKKQPNAVQVAKKYSDHKKCGFFEKRILSLEGLVPSKKLT